jgi:hypothetical protein
MFARFHDGVKARLEALDWASLIAALLPVILGLFANCKKSAVINAVRDGKLGPLERLRLVRLITRETGLRYSEAAALAQAMADEAQAQQAAPLADPSGATWIELAAEEVLAS